MLLFVVFDSQTLYFDSYHWSISLWSHQGNGNYVDVLAIESGALTLHGQLDLSDESWLDPCFRLFVDPPP
jgi:hypothetical protein